MPSARRLRTVGGRCSRQPALPAAGPGPGGALFVLYFSHCLHEHIGAPLPAGDRLVPTNPSGCRLSRELHDFAVADVAGRGAASLLAAVSDRQTEPGVGERAS